MPRRQDHILDTQNRVPCHDPRPAIPHDGPYLFSCRLGVARRRAMVAKSLVGKMAASVRVFGRLLDQVQAFGAEPHFPSTPFDIRLEFFIKPEFLRHIGDAVMLHPFAVHLAHRKKDALFLLPPCIDVLLSKGFTDDGEFAHFQRLPSTTQLHTYHANLNASKMISACP